MKKNKRKLTDNPFSAAFLAKVASYLKVKSKSKSKNKKQQFYKILLSIEMVSATTIATANPKKIIENRNKDMDIEKGNDSNLHIHTHDMCI